MLIPTFRAMHYLESRGVYGVVYYAYILFLFHVYSSTSTPVVPPQPVLPHVCSHIFRFATP
jgi:hypothetical protein